LRGRGELVEAILGPGERLLGSKKGKATVTTTATDDLGESAQDSLAVKFKKKK
jgi:hypothetical protein